MPASVGGMDEVLPGVFHWTAIHPDIDFEVSSYWLDDSGVLLDPLLPPEGADWFARRGTPPAAIVLSNRLHYRHSAALVAAFGVPVLVPRVGLHQFADRGPVTPYDPGDTLPGGLVVHEVGAICPDEMALHRADGRILVIADGVMRHGPDGPLGFAPDVLLDDPEVTKSGLLAAYEGLLSELEFDHLLLAHGGPVIGDGRDQLSELVAAGGRSAFEM